MKRIFDLLNKLDDIPSTNDVVQRANKLTEERLDIWCTVNNGEFGEYAIAGAKAGREYGLKHRGDHVKLHMINNFEWLKEQFNATV